MGFSQIASKINEKHNMGFSKHQKTKRVSIIFHSLQENQPEQCFYQTFNNNIKTNLQLEKKKVVKEENLQITKKSGERFWDRGFELKRKHIRGFLNNLGLTDS